MEQSRKHAVTTGEEFPVDELSDRHTKFIIDQIKPGKLRLQYLLSSLGENDQKQLNSISKFAGTLPNKSVTTKQWSEMIVETIREKLVRDLYTSVKHTTQVSSHAKLVLYWRVIGTLCRKYRRVYEPLFKLRIAKYFDRTFTVLGRIPQYREKLKLIRDAWSD